MYVIVVYDVSTERVGKVCKSLRRHLTWIQNSVFEGELSEAGLRKVQLDLQKIITGEDSVLFYCIANPKGWEKRVLGRERATTSTFL